MAAFSPYLEQKVIGTTLLGSTYTGSNTIWAALATVLNSFGNLFTEVATTTGYGRQPIVFGAPSAGATNNSTPTTWPSATTPWGGIVGIGLYDSIGGGNQLYYIPLTATQSITTSNVFQIPQNQLNIQLSGNWTTYAKNAILGFTLCGSTYTTNASPAAALYTAVTSNGDNTVEIPTATGYARTPMPFTAPNSVGGIYQTSNTATASYATATTPWGNVAYVGVCDSIALGNLLYWAPVTSAQSIFTNNQIQIPASNITIQLS